MTLSSTKYYGSKTKHLDFVLPLLPRARKYVEPFGGSGAVLLNRPRSEEEVWNDVQAPMASLMRACRDEGGMLARAVRLTPYARSELVHANPDGPDLEAARLILVSTHQAFMASANHGAGNWARQLKARGGGPSRVGEWINRADRMGAVSDRLQGVAIECRDALDVIRDHDSPDTLFYLDPPYVFSTRVGVNKYINEYPDEAHRELASVLNGIEGRAAVSGYASPLYDEELFTRELGWERHDNVAKTIPGSGGRAMSEIVWTNYRATARIKLRLRRLAEPGL